MVVLTIFSAVRDTVRESRGHLPRPEPETVRGVLQRLSARRNPVGVDSDRGVWLVVGNQFVQPEAQ